MDCSKTEIEAMTETTKVQKEDTKMKDNKGQTDQERGYKEHQTDSPARIDTLAERDTTMERDTQAETETIAEKDTQETIHKTGATTEKETTVMKGKGETMLKETDQMKEIGASMTTIEGEKDQEIPQGRLGGVKTKTKKSRDNIRREAERATPPEQRETETAQGAETHMIRGTERIGITETTQTQDQWKTKDLETAPDQGKTQGTENIPEEGTAQTTTEEDRERTRETSGAKAGTETHGKQYPSTKGT